MKNLLKIALTLLTGIVMSVGIFRPGLLMGTPASPAIGNWYQQFMPNLNGRTIQDITFLDSITGFSITSSSSDTSYILKTTNGGDNWLLNYRAPSFIFRKVQFLNNNTGYVAGQNLIKTTNGGVNWLPVNSSLFIEDIHFISNDTAWYADPNSFAGGVFFTTNGGATWDSQFSGGNQNPNRIYMYNARIGFMCNSSSATPNIYKTTNGGINWNINLPGEYFFDIHFTDSLTGWKCMPGVIAGDSSVKKTTNGGANWFKQNLPSGGIITAPAIGKFAFVSSDTIYGVGSAAFYGGGQFRGIIFRTINGGNNWLFQVPDTAIHIATYSYAQFVTGRIGWAYSQTTGIHTTTGGDITWITGLQQISSEIPKQYQLFQNYPNPFNPKTNIKYSVKSQTSNVKLIVFDILGKEISVLVNEELNPGTFEVNWDASNFPSGVYFYKILSEDYSESKKMVLVK